MGVGQTATARKPEDPQHHLKVRDFIERNTLLLGFLSYERGATMPPPGTKGMSIRKLAGILNQAADERNSDAYSAFLQEWLRLNGIAYPAGVFKVNFRPLKSGPSRTIDETQAQEIHKEYNSMPRPSFGEIAKRRFPKEWARHRKATEDKVRYAYNLVEQQIAAKPK